ncbi:hypothetical protein [Streptomyces sp. NPDC053367]|uniref:hypothetical protein n=1 Tax=Streptomyces sp. NPDC053367 TaxID=3365700 RepID=UPI0037D239E9
MTQVTGPAGGHAAPLLAREDCDRFEQRLQHAVAEFVDEPRHAVEEADRTLEEIAARFTDAVTRRRRTLRMSWQSGDAPGSTADDTERLRLALRDYRELAELLLHEGGGDGHDGGPRNGSRASAMGAAGATGTAGTVSGPGEGMAHGPGGGGRGTAPGAGQPTGPGSGDYLTPGTGQGMRPGTGGDLGPAPGQGMDPTPGHGMDPGAPPPPPPATEAQRNAMAKPQEDSPTVAPTPRSAEHPGRTERGDIA